MQQTQEINNTARDRISQALQVITDAAREQDEALDRARGRAIVDIQRVASAYTNVAERIQENLIEVVEEIRDYRPPEPQKREREISW
eukprot:5034904-Karenia_brevis.AAC.1